jgi:O-antigen/teichoic acid export membrane protein
MKADTLLVKDLRNKGDSLGTGSARQRFLVNVSSNVTFITASAVANLWLTPFLIGHLGIAAFGMIPLANSIMSYAAVLTTALDSAVSRFLTIELEQRDELAANKTFNTALFAVVGVIVALSPVVVTISLAFPYIFNVPPGWEKDASWLFATIAVAFFVMVIGSSFAVSPFVHSQFLLSNIANFAGLVARIGFIIILFSLLPARLWYAGGGALIAALVSLLGFVLLWRKLTPELHVQITAFDRSRLQSLMGMVGWVVVNMVGTMLLSRVDLIVVNAFFGAAMTGGYASVVQFSLLMEYLVSAAGTAVRPVILIKYAQQDLVGLQLLSSQSVKLLGLALALPVGLLCGFSRPLLSVWLGPSYQYLSVLLVIVIFHQSLNLSVRPLLHVQNAYNKVRWPGIATLLSGGASLGLAILLATWGKWGAAGVALAVAVSWTAKNAFYMPIYTAHIMKLRWWNFLPCLGPSVIGTLFVGLASYGLTLVRMPNNWLTLAGSAAIVSLVYAVVVWALGLSRTDRQLLKELSLLRATRTGASSRQ